MPVHYRYFYKHVDEPCWGPLERVAELTIVSPDLPVIDPGHFMYMARLESAGQSDLNLYKQYYTRYYLNLDDAGHAYVFVGTFRLPKGKRHLFDAGLYAPLPDLLTALGRLDLGFLEEAWMTDHDRESLARLISRKQRECHTEGPRCVEGLVGD
jgi:hypothetical protein